MHLLSRWSSILKVELLKSLCSSFECTGTDADAKYIYAKFPAKIRSEEEEYKRKQILKYIKDKDVRSICKGFNCTENYSF